MHFVAQLLAERLRFLWNGPDDLPRTLKLEWRFVAVRWLGITCLAPVLLLAHLPFESPHAYNQAMREAMYGWMTRWLKDEGTGKPIAEPKHDLEKPGCHAAPLGENRPSLLIRDPDEARHWTRCYRARRPLCCCTG